VVELARAIGATQKISESTQPMIDDERSDRKCGCEQDYTSAKYVTSTKYVGKIILRQRVEYTLTDRTCQKRLGWNHTKSMVQNQIGLRCGRIPAFAARDVNNPHLLPCVLVSSGCSLLSLLR
jgi:hypothetical protein